MAGIFYLSSRPGNEVGLPAPWDKLAHFLAYALLGFLLARGLDGRRAAFGIASLYGLLDEFHQSFTPGREVSLGDFLADALGAALGAFLARPQRGG
jgi:VanZ family protein